MQRKLQTDKTMFRGEGSEGRQLRHLHLGRFAHVESGRVDRDPTVLFDVEVDISGSEFLDPLRGERSQRGEVQADTEMRARFCRVDGGGDELRDGPEEGSRFRPCSQERWLLIGG